MVTVVLQEADPQVADPDLGWQDVATTVLDRSGTTAAAVHEAWSRSAGPASSSGS